MFLFDLMRDAITTAVTVYQNGYHETYNVFMDWSGMTVSLQPIYVMLGLA